MSEWQAYWLLEPWGDDWQRTALLALMYAEAHRDRDERDEPFSLADFMPRLPSDDFDDEQPADEAESYAPGEEPWRQWKAAMEALTKGKK